MTNKKRKTSHHLYMNQNDYRMRLQEVLFTPEHIFTKIFRKDGPSLGVEFDSLPANAFLCDPIESHDEENRQSGKRKKVPVHTIIDYQDCCENSSPAQRHGIGKGIMTAKHALTKKHGRGKCLMTQNGAPGKKHGIGKGFMSVWRNTYPNARDFASGDNVSRSPILEKKKRVQRRVPVVRKSINKDQAKKKTSVRNRKQVECQTVQKRKQFRKEKCELALENVKFQENTEQFAMLQDDEELELRELQAGPNPLTCSAHFPTTGSHGCSLCKDLLPKFPPNSVTMKPPLSMQPWASLPDLVNKLFKTFQFLSTYAVTICGYSFTFDEFVQSFHEKDALLLGQVHMALLKLLLSDIKKESKGEFFSHASKNCKFISLLHSLEYKDAVLELWQKSLNSLTWTEILRQVLAAAGFGSKLGTSTKGAFNKEISLMERYGLSSGTLKGELFSILFIQGNSGMQVSDLAKSSSIVDMNLTDTFLNLEDSITSVLSGDVTLFEKISSSGYRLRVNAAAQEAEDYASDFEDSGSVYDISEGTTVLKITNDLEIESRNLSPSKLEQDVCKSKSNMLTVYNEIDESYPGEAWFLGLMEGEYSDLSIEEKLNTLTALIDLLSAGSTIRMEDPRSPSTECHHNIKHCGSGAKIKRTEKRCNSHEILGSCVGQTISSFGVNASEQPIDSLVPMSKIGEEEKHANMKKLAEQMEADYLHPMQSIFLGSDRRYNRYWLFLGPCDELDPGHRRIYFESSEDRHWEMIDTQEALCILLSSLDRRGAREARLLTSLEKCQAILCQAMSSVPDVINNEFSRSYLSELNTSREQSSSPVSDVDNQLSLRELQNEIPSTDSAVIEARKKAAQQVDMSGRAMAFDAWIWKYFYSELKSVKSGNKAHLDSLRRCGQCHDLFLRDEKHCRICHTTFELDFDLDERYAIHSAVCRANADVDKCRKLRILSSQLQALKAAVYAIESVIPEDAWLGSWKRSHNLWVNRLRRASSLTEYLQVLADFVFAINEEWFHQNLSGSSCVADELFLNFSAVPQTYSAVALWLVKLDLLVASHKESTCS